MNKSLSILIALMGLTFIFSACVEPNPVYTIPTSYNFDNVNYSGQTQRLNMLTELKAYMTTANTSGTAIDASRMKAMFANDAETANFAGTYEESKQLKNKILESEQGKFEALMDEMAAASQSTVPGEEGVSGVIGSLNGEKQYLIGEDGLEHAQLIEKGIMGACFYYQGTAVYMGEGKMNVDNTEVTEGKGTTMEHHWDEAFGYLGVPKAFPSDQTGLQFWGKYINGRNELLGSNAAVMNAFLKGRAAISNDDLATRDEAISEARAAWELVSAGTALHYINSGIENFDDMALRAHGLSEAIAFIYSLKFNPEKTLNNEQIDALLVLIANSADFDQMNLYQSTKANLQQAKNDLAAAFSLEDKKDLF